ILEPFIWILFFFPNWRETSFGSLTRRLPRCSLIMVMSLENPVSTELPLHFTLERWIAHGLLKPRNKIVNKHQSIIGSLLISKIKVININFTLFTIVSHSNNF
ncbi:hypothetical protein DD599_26610, partial [Enterobacter cloacae complex sp. CH23B]